MIEPRIDILRPWTASPLISAQTFEHGFVVGMGEQLRIETLDATAWPETLLANERDRESAARALADLTANADFLCPSPGPLAWSPELLRLRNLGGAPVRALFIAHAPGVFLPEWALLAPLLGPGDRIVAPSETAAAVITMLCPSLASYVRVIPHPIVPWLQPHQLASRRPASPRIVGLSRLVRDKLLHRAIEALDILRGRGLRPRLELAGPLAELGGEGPSAYVRSLQAKIEQRKLGDQVSLVGTIEDPAAKLEFVAGASMLMNLSVSLEESFGKAIAEAQTCGVPSLCTRWGGLDETADAGGIALPVEVHEFGVDVDAEVIADAIEMLLDAPPSPASCYELGRRFHPDQVATRYRAVLDEAREEFEAAGRHVVPEPDARLAAGPTTGLLAGTAPLRSISWSEAMWLHADELRVPTDLRGLTDPDRLVAGAQLRGLLCLAVRAAVQRTQAGLAIDEPVSGDRTPKKLDDAPSFLELCADATCMRGTRSSRVIILDLLQRLDRGSEVERGLAHLRSEGLDSKGMRYIEIEAQLRAGAADAAVAMCTRDFDAEELGEREAHRLLQFARACQQAGQPDLALPALRRWTARFPDTPDAAGVWQQRALLALLAEHNTAEAVTALRRCIALVGPRPETVGLLAALSGGL